MKWYVTLLALLVINFLNAQYSVFNSQYHSGFIENKGQIEYYSKVQTEEVDFKLSRGNVQVFILKGGGVAYQMVHLINNHSQKPVIGHSIEEENRSIGNGNSSKQYLRTNRMDVHLIGANGQSEVIKEEEHKDYINFVSSGNTLTKHYGKITYRNVYEGIDWVLYTVDDGIKYDFVVHPGADPSKIKLKYSFHDDLYINESLDIIQTNKLGFFKEKAPISYQGDKIIETKFRLRNDIIDFIVEPYDSNRVLIIDPPRVWGTYFGGTSVDDAHACDIDLQGNIVIAGVTYSNIGLAHAGNDSIFGGAWDGYVAKFDSSGNRLWATYFGGNKGDVIADIAVGPSGSIYLTGSTLSDTGIAYNGFQDSLNGYSDAFVAKLDSAGVLVWSTYFGGPSAESGAEIDLDSNENVFIVGTTSSPSGIATPYAFQTSLNGSSNGFLSMLSSSGVKIWCTYYGGQWYTNGTGCAIDNSSNIYISGNTISDTGIAHNGYQDSLGGNNDSYLAKFTLNGSRVWGTYYGGPFQELIGKCAVDGLGNVYLSGETRSLSGIAYMGHQDTNSGNVDAYLVKFDSTGNRSWGTYLGGTLMDRVAEIHTDYLNNVYLAGRTESINGLATTNGFQPIYGGGTFDGYITKFSSSGNCLWGSYYGGNGFDEINDIASSQNNLYAVGGTTSNSAIAKNGFQNTRSGPSDGFLVKFLSECSVSFSFTVNSCNQYTLPSGSISVSTSGIYYDTLYTNDGCDSLLTINVNIFQSDSSNINLNGCQFLLSPSGNTTWLHSGNYIDTVKNTVGCDSILYVNLYLTKIDTTINVNGLTFESVEDSGSYQWIDCFSNSPVLGATSKYFTPSENGSYAVAIEKDGCVDTSQCVSISNIGIREANQNQIVIYPNPTTNFIVVKSALMLEGSRFQIIDVNGRVIVEDILNSPLTRVNVEEWEPGDYIFNIEGVISEKINVLK